MKNDPSSDQLEMLNSGRIMPLLIHFAGPALVTLALNVLYNIVDRIYIGNGCGKEAVAGITLTMPFALVLTAVGVLIGVGSGTIISIKLGENDVDSAERALGQCVAMKILFGLIVPPILLGFGMFPLLRFMGGDNVDPLVIKLASQYLLITVPFTLTAHLGFGLAGCIRSEGAPTKSMYCMVAGCLVNIILDPIFIYTLKMGMAGAAWATSISQLCSCLLALLYYLRGKSLLKLRLRNISIFKDLYLRVLGIGLCPFLMQLAQSLISLSMNHSFSEWSESIEAGTINVAAMGIVNAIGVVSFTPMMGIQQGLGPIFGYNWGAKNYKRIMDVFRLGLKLTMYVGFIVFLVQEIFALSIVNCFTNDSQTAVTGAYGLRLANICLWMIGINVTATTYFQSIGRPKVAIVISLLRQCICLLPCVWILPRLFPSYAILAIWLAIPLSDIVSCLATTPMLFLERRRLLKCV